MHNACKYTRFHQQTKDDPWRGSFLVNIYVSQTPWLQQYFPKIAGSAWRYIGRIFSQQIRYGNYRRKLGGCKKTTPQQKDRCSTPEAYHRKNQEIRPWYTIFGIISWYVKSIYRLPSYPQYKPTKHSWELQKTYKKPYHTADVIVCFFTGLE